MHKAELIEHTFQLQQGDLSYLLFLRVILDVKAPANALEQDIEDLYRFPERLESSYRYEWSSYIKRELVARAFESEQQTDATNLLFFVENEYAQRKQEIDTVYQECKKTLDQAKVLAASPNVLPMRTPLHDILDRLMKV